MSFSDLGLSPELLQAIAGEGYSEATPIQQQAIPVILAGKDVMACAQTGTGKTAGFSLPILQLLQPHANTSTSPARHAIRALILTPTRELAAQVEESVKAYSKHIPLRSAVIYGGVNMDAQVAQLKSGVEIVVSTPGRLLDHVQQRTVNLSQVQILVLDEADRMLDMGFIRDIRRIIELLPQQRQNLLFSATFSNDIKKLADSLLKDPTLIEVARRNAAAETVRQLVYLVDQDKKRALLTHLIKSQDLSQVLVFCRTKHGANRLASLLTRDGVNAAAIHSDKTQSAREQALAEFKNGDVRVLVATDIAARGLDIEELPHVVNFEISHVPEDYVHRIGRTGRAKAEGVAISLIAPDEMKLLKEVEKLLKRPIECVVAKDFDDDSSSEPTKTPSPRSTPRAESNTRSKSTPSRARQSNHSPGAASIDPIFTQPYVPAEFQNSTKPALPTQQNPKRTSAKQISVLLGGGKKRSTEEPEKNKETEE